MKVLMDENLDHRLRRNLRSNEIFTASYMGWAGLKNGKLLNAAEAKGFDVFLTGDQSLYDEQNLLGRKLAIVVMSSVEWHIVKGHLPAINAAINKALPGSYQAIDCGTFSRKRMLEK